jgi:hypothetical protein
MIDFEATLMGKNANRNTIAEVFKTTLTLKSI